MHLLHTRPAGAAATIDTLRTAAREAVADGALDTAVAYLERALVEPPRPDRRAPLVLELGEVEADHGVAGAAERLTEALASDQLTPDERARARAARARQLILRDPRQAADDLEAAIADADDPDTRLRLQSLLFDASAYVPDLDERRQALLRSDPSPVVLAHRAQDAAYRSRPASEVATLARQALEGGDLLRVVGPQATYHLLVMALRHAEQPALAAEALKAGEAEVHRLGSRFAMYFMDHARAYWELMYGSVTAAEAHARSALAITEEAALPLGRMTLVAMLAEVAIERDLDEAERQLASLTMTPELERVISGSDLIGVRAELHRLRGRLDEAERDARRARELRAGARVDDAAEVARRDPPRGDADRRPARRRGTSRARRGGGRGHPGGHPGHARDDHPRARPDRRPGHPPRGRRAARALRDAARARARPARGRRARPRARRGRQDRRDPHRRPRPRGRGAGRTARGAHPGRAPGGGTRRGGLGDREIAETLWVTRRTVEVQLSSALAKLGVRERGDLARALALP